MPAIKKAKTSKATAIATQDTTLTVTAGPRARTASVFAAIEKEYIRGGCPGCRSGKDRIVFKDPVIRNVK